MPRVIQPIQIEGQTVWVEVEDVVVQPRKSASTSGDARFADTASPGSIPRGAVDAIEQADISSTLNAVIGPVKKALESFKPDEVNVELTLGFKAEVGVFVASGEANAQIKVSAKWKPTAN
jgi:hypothetical protein